MSKERYVGTESAEPVMYRCEWDTEEYVLPGSRFGPVVRGVYVVECNVYGYGTVVINDREFPVTPGDTYIIRPGQRVIQTAAITDPRRALWCSFGGMRVAQLLDDVGIDDASPFLPRSKTQAVRSTLEKIYSLNGDNSLAADLSRTARLYDLFATVADGHAALPRNLFVQRAVGIMESGYNTGLTVADIAAEIGFDRSYFSTIFRQHTGTAPHAYLTSLRIDRACALLSGGHTAVSDVAESVGLDPRNFSRLFKRHTGKTPNEYKRSADQPKPT